VLAAVGLTESQLPPDFVVAAGVNAKADELLLVTCTFLGTAVPPTGAVKLRVAELSTSVGRVGGATDVTLKVTATVCGLLVALVEAMVTAPV
jgi:hypothetical protein